MNISWIKCSWKIFLTNSLDKFMKTVHEKFINQLFHLLFKNIHELFKNIMKSLMAISWTDVNEQTWTVHGYSWTIHDHLTGVITLQDQAFYGHVAVGLNCYIKLHTEAYHAVWKSNVFNWMPSLYLYMCRVCKVPSLFVPSKCSHHVTMLHIRDVKFATGIKNIKEKTCFSAL